MLVTDSPSSLPVRRRRQESPQRAVVRFQHSGLTQRAFCEQAGIPVSTLQWWLAKTRREAVPPVSFTEVLVPALARPARDEGAGWAVEIVTRTGVTVRLREPLRPVAVRALLRGTRC